jgi:predicted metal-dependent phosphotriesterase family hydrolase
MADVMTVLGPVNADSLGRTLMHEHLIIDMEQNFRGGIVATLDDVDIAIEEVRTLMHAGGTALVELSNKSIGRDVLKLRHIAEATGLHIIAASGYYKEQTYPQEVFDLTVPELARLFVRELTEGVEGTGIRTGIIGELATFRRRITPAEERVFRAAARAQQVTGVAISTHTYWGGELGLEQVAVLMDAGVRPDRIIIGHLGDKRTYDYYARIGDTGVFMQFDHIGKEFLPERDRAVIIKEMIDRGYLDQILLSLDICYRPELHYFGGIGYDHLYCSFVPALRAAGVTEAEINTVLVDNPRRALAGRV